MHQPNLVMLLLSAITVLGGVIVYLALYIRKLHNKQTDLAIRFTETAEKLQGTIEANTKMGEDLHRTIIDVILRK